MQVSSATANDFTNPVVCTVTAADGSTASCTVTVTVVSPSSGAMTALTTVTIMAACNGVTKAAVLSVAPATGVQALFWDLSDELRASPDAQNPSPDRYGNANVCHYMTNANAAFDSDGCYAVLTKFKTGQLGMWPVNTPLFQEWKTFHWNRSTSSRCPPKKAA